MMKLLIKYNNKDEELEITRRVANKSSKAINSTVSFSELEIISKEIDSVHIDLEVERYIVDIVRKTREENSNIKYGASPRASIDLYKASKAHAYLNGKDFVTPVDIVTMAYPVLRHRVGLSYEARAGGVSVDSILKEIINSIDMP